MKTCPKHSKEEIKAIALKFTGRRQWMLNHGPSWRQARRIGLEFYEECCAHMELKPNPFTVSIYSIYAFEFSDKSVYVGLTHKGEERKFEHLSDPVSPVFKKIQSCPDYVWKICQDKITGVSVAGKIERLIIKDYFNLNWIILNKTKGGEPGSVKCRVTNQQIIENALLFDYVSDWSNRLKNENYYWRYLAKKRGIFEQVTAHMKLKHRKTSKFKFLSDIEYINQAKNFKSIKEWRKTKIAYTLMRHKKYLYKIICDNFIADNFIYEI